MTFIAANLQKNTMTLQKSQLEYQSMIMSSNVQQTTQALSTLASNNADMESNQVKQLQYLSQLYTQQQAAVDSQLKALNSQLEGFNKMIDANIKNDCKLNLLG